MKITPALLVFTTAILFADGLLASSAHEVTVFSRVTAAGRKHPVPSLMQPATCRLVGGGYQELGDGRPDPLRVAPAAVLNPLFSALTKRFYQATRDAEAKPSLLIVCHWGVATPPQYGAGPEFNHARAEMLGLVGGEAIGHSLQTEREAILTAANDERYFVIVSAYDFEAYAADHTQTLMWRTQMSVPTYGTTPEQAWPLLVVAGTALFGLETPQPRRISIPGSGVLNTDEPLE
jgi:hypothetical protein